MRSLANTIKKLWKDESAQGATEYILLLVIVVAIAMLFKDRIKSIVSSKIEEVGSGIGSFSIDK
jgi:hypothetical protein